MSKVEEMVMVLADTLRKEGKNFVILVEDGEIHSQSSVKGNSLLRGVSDLIKKF